MDELRKNYPRDVFMHLLSVTALYVSAFAIINLLFNYIDVNFPDILDYYYDVGIRIRWALSLLAIIFPAFLLTSWFINKDLNRHPEKNELRIRRWLIYLTIFAAAVLIIGDLIALIYKYLEGELTIRFFLKVLSVLAVAAGVFGYYLYILKKKTGEFSPGAKIFTWSVVGLVVLIVGYGFFLAGSPAKQRLIKYDRGKISDLQNIQNQIVNYWSQKGKLPLSLDDLIDSISGFAPPKDPQTQSSYEYQATGGLSFELCAQFNFDSKEGRLGAPQPRPIEPFGYRGENWEYQAGEFCFDRVIDPELYKKREVID